LHTATQTTAGCSTDGRALTTAGNSADNRTDAGAGSDFGGRILASGRTFAAILIGLYVLVRAADGKAVQLQREH